jgi:hypothetical protein
VRRCGLGIWGGFRAGEKIWDSFAAEDEAKWCDDGKISCATVDGPHRKVVRYSWAG